MQSFKEAMRKSSEDGSIQTRVRNYLFHDRITPSATTGLAPSELLMGRKLRNRFDLLYPNLAEQVSKRQLGQKQGHDLHTRERQFLEGKSAYVKNYGPGERWIAGKIVERTGPLSFKIQLSDGRIVRRHQDQMHPN